MAISEKILKLRKNKGLSQEAFAEALGVSRQSVSKWESGDVLPDSDKIILMSELFGVTTDYLLKENADEAEPEQQTESAEISEEKRTEKMKKKEKKKLKSLRIIAAVLALCIVITAVALPIHFGGVREAWWAVCGGKVKYPYVLVHGLGGWGEDTGINTVARYWGGDAGDISAHLKANGIEVCEPSVGPFSSNWDRVCELYAQLTGTRVDYGEAHSKEHNHERFGEEFTTPLVENWGEKINGGQKVKVNLVGHSFGGATVRTLAYLLEYGDEAEKEASGDDVSPLFKGGRGDWIYSVTTLCAPHNGSSLTEALDTVTDGIGNLGSLVGIDTSKFNSTQLLATVSFGLAGLGTPLKGTYDFKLGQFGIGKAEGGLNGAIDTISALVNMGTDHAGYDLSPDGAAKINSYVKTVKDVYYFSYAYCTTKEGKLIKGQVPAGGTLPVLYAPAMIMGKFKGETDGGIVIDEKWQANDGLVSVVSAQYPDGAEHFDCDGKTENIKAGVWNFMGTSEGDHGTVIGLKSTAEETFGFYDNLTTMIDSIER